MFHFRHKPRGLKNSTLITVISVIENYASAMMTLIVPLYLYAVFKSELVIGQISFVSGIASVIITLTLGFLLSSFSRAILYKLGAFLALGSIAIFFILELVPEAYIAHSLWGVAGILTPAILSLYIRDLSTPEDLPHNQGVYSAVVNLAWLTGPMIAGALISFFEFQQESIIQIFPVLSAIQSEYFLYIMPLIIALALYFIALFIFTWHKFVIKHPHLQESEKSQESDQVHHHKYLGNFIEHFKDKKRTLSFINQSFIAVWWIFIFTYFAILLEQHEVNATHIGIILGLISLPNVLFEAFVDSFMKKVGGSENALLYGYGFFFIFVSAAFFIGYENIYIFSVLLILSQIGVAVTEPLQELQYFEGTDEKTEGKFYTIHKLGGEFFSLVTPVLIGIGIGIWGIDSVFQIIPFLFIPLFGILFFLKGRN